MIPFLTLIFVVALSMFVTKTATIALMRTGMARERAQFQARSAFSGAGFTTSESEMVVKHPVRRRIVTALILLGNAGVVTAISSLILGFVNPESGIAQTRNVLLLGCGILLLLLTTRWQRFDRWLERIIDWMLDRFSDIQPRNLSRLLVVMEDFEITSLKADEVDWMTGCSLAELKLPDEGILVLGILRNDHTYLGVPRGRYVIEESDQVILYGKAERLADLSKRHDRLAGRAAHRKSVETHQEELEEQDEAAGETGRED